MRSTFDSTVGKILKHCRQLCLGKDVKVSSATPFGFHVNLTQHLILVGGFGESLYLREQLKRLFRNSGIEIATIEHPT